MWGLLTQTHFLFSVHNFSWQFYLKIWLHNFSSQFQFIARHKLIRKWESQSRKGILKEWYAFKNMNYFLLAKNWNWLETEWNKTMDIHSDQSYEFNPLLPYGNCNYSLLKISFLKKEGIKKNFLWAPRLWVGRRWEPILGYISKFDGKKVSGSNGLRQFRRDKLPLFMPGQDLRQANSFFSTNSNCSFSIKK